MIRCQWFGKAGGGLLLVVAAIAGQSQSAAAPAGRAKAAETELWRRGHCINSSVVRPAEKLASVPGDLRGAEPAGGRTFSLKAKITAWTRDEEFLWVATDSEIIQIELSGKQQVRSYCKADGLPGWPVDELLSDGRRLWIVHRRGLATLEIGRQEIDDQKDVRFRFARLLRDDGGVWVIADGGTYRFARGSTSAQPHPALPPGRRIADALERGIWLARRKQKTAYFIADPQGLDGRLYVASYGAVYELAEGKWTEIAAEGFSPKVGHGCVWFLSTKGLVRYNPETKSTSTYAAPDPLPAGRPTHLVVTRTAVWVAVEPRADGRGKDFTGGGLARLEVASGRWQTWREINDRRADRVTALEVHEDAVWAATIDYDSYQTLSAHPGMMHCTRAVPVYSGLCLHRFVSPQAGWKTVRLQTPACERRQILGQKGSRKEAVMIPRSVEGIAAGSSRLFGVVNVFPKDYYSGYYTCVDQLAVRQDPASAWQPEHAHRPEQLNLQGEQPEVLLISESHGEKVVYGVGHDRVCGLFSQAGQVWAVSEGCVGWFDSAEDRWQKVLETGFRFYWKATAALDDGRYLWIGSDRGLVSRLDLGTGRFEMLTVLKDREIVRIVQDGEGRILVTGRPADPGCLPVQLQDKLPALDTDLAGFDGHTWTAAQTAPPPADGRPHWSSEEKSNFLWRADRATGQRLAKFYVTGVFRIDFLCASPDDRRIWLSTYSGLLRLDN